MSNSDFINFLNGLQSEFFLESEAKTDKMMRFINEYNIKYSPAISLTSSGICILSDDVDKWGVELRIYLNDTVGMPKKWADRMYRNRKFRADEFSYRIDDNTLVWELFDNGFRIGYN